MYGAGESLTTSRLGGGSKLLCKLCPPQGMPLARRLRVWQLRGSTMWQTLTKRFLQQNARSHLARLKVVPTSRTST